MTSVEHVYVDGVRLRVHPLDAHWVAGWFEETSRRLLHEALPHGGVLVDVGAHVGIVSLLAARHVGEQGHVHAIEASPQTLALLEENAAANSIENLTIHGCAAGAARGTTDFHIMKYSGLSGLAVRSGDERVDTVQVELRPLDDLVSGRVDVVKIDVEGFEIAVLEGMSRIVAENPGLVVCVEWNPFMQIHAGHKPTALLDVLTERGFELTAVVDEMNGGAVRDFAPLWAAVSAGMVDRNWCGNVFARRL